MPILDKLIFENRVQILDPISEQVAERFLKYIGIYDLFKHELYFKSIEQSGSIDMIDEKNIITDNRCDIEIKPNYNAKGTKWENFNTSHIAAYGNTRRSIFSNYPVFADKANKVYLLQFDIPRSVELTFSLKLKSIELADMISSALFTKGLTDSVFQYTAVDFSYPLPDTFLFALYKFYQMQDIDKSQISFKDYLTIGTNAKIGQLVNRDNSDIKQIIINQSLNRVLYSIEYSPDEPEPEKKEKISDRYIVNFSLFFQFSSPNMLRLAYPYVINNIPIPSILIPKRKTTFDKDLSSVFNLANINHYFYNINEKYNYSTKYPTIQYPPNIDDNTILGTTIMPLQKNYYPVFIGILLADIDQLSNLYLLIDFENDIYPLLNDGLKEQIDKAFEYQNEYHTLNFLGIFSFAIIKDNKYIIKQDKIIIDMQNKTLRVNEHIDNNSEYKLIIYQIKNINIIYRDYIYEILNNPEYFDFVILNNLNILKKNGFITIEDDNTIIINQNEAINASKNNINNYYYRNNYRVGKYLFKIMK